MTFIYTPYACVNNTRFRTSEPYVRFINLKYRLKRIDNVISIKMLHDYHHWFCVSITTGVCREKRQVRGVLDGNKQRRLHIVRNLTIFRR